MSVMHQSVSFFERTNSQRQRSLFQTQYDPSMPGAPTLRSGSGLIVPDYLVDQQMAHFPEELYDLRPESHLVRLMKAILGDSGAGQLRKRYLMARFQQVMSSTHFFDLDSFYGALFGINRRRYEAIPINPYRDVATPDEWDDIHVSDTSFRERIVALAKAIPMGGSPRGMQTAAEAITGTPCDILENWARMDYYLARGYDPEPGMEVQPEWVPRQWADVESAFTSYADMDDDNTQNWNDVSFHYKMPDPRNGLDPITGDRTAWTVRPRIHYSGSYWDQETKAEDALSIRQVLNVLKPSGSRLLLAMNGVNLHVPEPIRGITADSEHWEISSEVEPYAASDVDLTAVYPLSYGQLERGLEPSEAHILPRPPFSSSAGEGWSYNTEVVSVSSFSIAEDGAVSQPYNYEIVNFYDGSQTTYGPSLAVMDPQQAEAARLASDGSLMAAPYSQERVVVQTHD